MKLLTSTVSKYLFILPFLAFGAFHFMSADAMASMSPIGVAGVYITGAALIAAAVAVLINKMARLALLLLGVLLLIFVFAVHVPSMGTNDMAMVMILKDVALAGGAWILADRYES